MRNTEEDLSPVILAEPEKVPRLVTAIQSYWIVMTLTKPFSAACALVSLSARGAKEEIWMSSQMPVFHAFDTQAFTVWMPGGVESI